jgi:molybdopterin-guanine dinucleotide biosynthesis protein A
MIGWVASVVEEAGLSPVLSLGRRGSPPFPLPVVRDCADFEGPLAAIAAALEEFHQDLLVIGCDQPLVPASILKKLAQGLHWQPRFCSCDSQRLGPLPGVFPFLLLPSIKNALACGERSPRRWAESQGVEWLPIAAGEVPLLRSLNSPDDLREAFPGGFS